MSSTYAVNQQAIAAAGARPCAFGHVWLLPSAASGMKKDGTATPRPLGRLPD